MIYNGIEALRDASIIHRDLKPENILLEKSDIDANLKIGDFGLSRKADLKLTVGIGTPVYSAPEVIKRAEYGEEIDIWALGLILFEMVNGAELYVEASNLVQLIALQEKT